MNHLASVTPPTTIAALWSATCASGFAMASEPLTGSLLRTLAATKPNGQFLELGSGTGLSSAWLLDGMNTGAHLTTVDNDEQVLALLKTHLGADPRLTVVCADGDAFLGNVQCHAFDFIFADTWAGKYHLLDAALALVRPGGLYVIDDMLPQTNWPTGHAEKVAHLIAALEKRKDFYITKMSWASGIIVAARCG